jgi:hypothetical protein
MRFMASLEPVDSFGRTIRRSDNQSAKGRTSARRFAPNPMDKVTIDPELDATNGSYHSPD